jgi:hypothetical protein
LPIDVHRHAVRAGVRDREHLLDVDSDGGAANGT